MLWSENSILKIISFLVSGGWSWVSESIPKKWNIEKKVTLQWRNLANTTTLAIWPRLTSPVINHVDNMYYQYDVPRRALSYKRYNPSLPLRKKIRQTHIKRHSTKYLASTSQSCQSHQNKKDWEDVTDQIRLRQNK